MALVHQTAASSNVETYLLCQIKGVIDT